MNVTQDEEESPSKEKATEDNEEEEANPESLPSEQSPPIPDTEEDSGSGENIDVARTVEDQTDIGMKRKIFNLSTSSFKIILTTYRSI